MLYTIIIIKIISNDSSKRGKRKRSDLHAFIKSLQTQQFACKTRIEPIEIIECLKLINFLKIVCRDDSIKKKRKVFTFFIIEEVQGCID